MRAVLQRENRLYLLLLDQSGAQTILNNSLIYWCGPTLRATNVVRPLKSQSENGRKAAATRPRE